MSETVTDKPKVYVSAIICEDVVREETSRLLTAVRITNAFIATPAILTPRLPDGTRDIDRQEIAFRPVKFRVIISFYCESKTSFSFILKGSKPNGEPLNAMSDEMPLELPAAGVHSLNITSYVSGSLSGVYWIGAYVDGELATKIMLVIVHATEPEQLFPTE